MPETACWLEIDRATIVANARALAAKAAPAALCAVVKSNAYGHGMVPVAQALADAQIPGLRLGVFTIEEAFGLRGHGISLPIFVVGPVGRENLAEAAAENIELALLDERDCEAFAAARVAAHLKVESGTNRFGVAAARAPQALERCEQLGLRLTGLYSHLANAEDIDKPFALQQLDALKRVAGAAKSRPMLHIAASAAAMMWPEMRLDMVRCGIAIYGAWPSPAVEAVMAGEDPSFVLRPALRWFAPIVQIRDAHPGETVGYGRTFAVTRESKIAVLAVGYDDGLPRAAGEGRMRVRIGDARAPIVGRIAMNTCVIDVTDVAPWPAPGDIVEFEIEPLARAAGTINYEVLARLPEHLQRRYL
ncbi:MAG: alanine racemase [Candidatus Eremiobacteraeota bacterium]|nr:alanine racemase [Candidatus Eremiobacteraeota bacterium]